MPEIDHGVRHQLHTVMALLFEFETQRQPFELVLSQTFLTNERSPGRQINLVRKGIELTRRTQFASQQQLALPDHVHQFNAGESHGRGPEGFEPQHRSCLSLDGSVILLDDVVEVFDLAYLNTSFGLGVVTLDRRRVGTALVNRDLFRCAVASYRFA